MKLVIFGLTVSSAWGNGHATLWRGLLRALARKGHEAVFFEKDVPYYAQHRDLVRGDGYELVLYPSFDEVLPAARRALDTADVAMVTSYCPDARRATDLVLASPGRHVFYDMDTPITLAALARGEEVPYLPARGLGDFDLVLSYTGGAALSELGTLLGARRVAPLYGSVDPDVHAPAAPAERYRADLSYLGTYSDDRQATLDRLFVEPARRSPGLRFLIGGAQYPAVFPWTPNIWFVRHLPPSEHPAFYSSSRATLNVTRGPMAEMGYCPSGRLFEAAACGTPVLSDEWEGLSTFFRPGEEILTAREPADVLAALALPDEELAAVGRRARERTLAEHVAERRALELEDALERRAPGTRDERVAAGL